MAALKEVPVASRVTEETPESRRGAAVGTQARPIELTKRGTPRQRAPKGTGFDRKAYQREKAKLRRAKLKDG